MFVLSNQFSLKKDALAAITRPAHMLFDRYLKQWCLFYLNSRLWSDLVE